MGEVEIKGGCTLTEMKWNGMERKKMKKDFKVDNTTTKINKKKYNKKEINE